MRLTLTASTLDLSITSADSWRIYGDTRSGVVNHRGFGRKNEGVVERIKTPVQKSLEISKSI